MSSITQVPPSVLPLLSLIEDYNEIARTSKNVTSFNIYKMVVKDLQQILREIKEK